MQNYLIHCSNVHLTTSHTLTPPFIPSHTLTPLTHSHILTTLTQLGNAECSITSSNSTQITCVTPPHNRGSVDVAVSVEGRGSASSINVSFEFVTEVTHLSHCSG